MFPAVPEEHKDKTGTYATSEDNFYLHAATLDDPSGFKPQFAVHEEAAQPWDAVPRAPGVAGR